jgi:hypothetical protein
LAVDPVDGTLNYVIALLLSPIIWSLKLVMIAVYRI